MSQINLTVKDDFVRKTCEEFKIPLSYKANDGLQAVNTLGKKLHALMKRIGDDGFYDSDVESSDGGKFFVSAYRLDYDIEIKNESAVK